MAELLTIKCPKCGHLFKITKGVLMSWDFSKPIPKELREETPFNCPKCNHQMSVLDDDINEHVVESIFMD
jgi:transcription elongation factor Elf1